MQRLGEAGAALQLSALGQICDYAFEIDAKSALLLLMRACKLGNVQAVLTVSDSVICAAHSFICLTFHFIDTTKSINLLLLKNNEKELFYQCSCNLCIKS